MDEHSYERTGSSYDLKQAPKADRSFIIDHFQSHMLCYIRGAGWPGIEIAQSQNHGAQLKERVSEKIFSPSCARQVFKVEKASGARVKARPLVRQTGSVGPWARAKPQVEVASPGSTERTRLSPHGHTELPDTDLDQPTV